VAHRRRQGNEAAGGALPDAAESIGEVADLTANWPEWWAWELELTAHLLKRMEDRAFNEVDLRHMLEHSSGYRNDILAGRFVVFSKHQGRRWEIITELMRNVNCWL
jgi:hypothetical protein